MVKITEDNEFKREIETGVVVVDFFATWCPPCKMLAPIFDKLSLEMEGKVKFTKVDVDSSTNIASEYNITNVPAIVIFKNGKKKEMLVGFRPKESIEAQIERYL
ncbi:thioredoxin [Clostridium estertheticum]|uniref:thioredoxin n=1 Tax=Clostridium estertheticum TaxID=238834 RepID=UPI001CF4E382|nr:thioredoxin [Clostridium estertheticum]MCB2342870.1 thioredoxin [Clostridium estertheticum]